ncbi:MAG: CBS domain-containing protein [Pseudomonadota bacterium]
MLVQHLLDRKASGVTTIGAEATIADAAAELSARKIGVLLISSDGSALDGILSERDIVRGLATSGAGVLTQPVSKLMTSKVVSCTPGDTVTSVLDKMSSGNFRHMPVLTDGKLTGILSLRDLMGARVEMAEAENSALTGMIAGY